MFKERQAIITHLLSSLRRTTRFVYNFFFFMVFLMKFCYISQAKDIKSFIKGLILYGRKIIPRVFV